MDYVIIKGVAPWDGRYELDPNADFTTREWGWIKRLAGYMPLTIEDAFTGGDPELYAVLAVVALHRAGRIQARDAADVFERIADAPFGSTITLDTDRTAEDTEDDASPPSPNLTANAPTNGDGLRTSSETSDENHEPIGIRDSGSSAFPSVRLET